MKKEYKKSRYYDDNGEYNKRFRIKPYSRKNSDKIKNNLKQFIYSGDKIDEEFLDSVDNITDAE